MHEIPEVPPMYAQHPKLAAAYAAGYAARQQDRSLSACRYRDHALACAWEQGHDAAHRAHRAAWMAHVSGVAA